MPKGRTYAVPEKFVAPFCETGVVHARRSLQKNGFDGFCQVVRLGSRLQQGHANRQALHKHPSRMGDTLGMGLIADILLPVLVWGYANRAMSFLQYSDIS